MWRVGIPGVLRLGLDRQSIRSSIMTPTRWGFRSIDTIGRLSSSRSVRISLLILCKATDDSAMHLPVGIVRFAVRCLCWQFVTFVAQLMSLHPFFAFFIWITNCANIRSPYFPRNFLRTRQSPQNVGEHSLGYMPNGPTIDYQLSTTTRHAPGQGVTRVRTF